jgi:uncharacterized membrane protein
MAGAAGGQIPAGMRRILYDDGFRRQLAAVRQAFLADHAIASDGRAAERAADAILALVREPVEH